MDIQKLIHYWLSSAQNDWPTAEILFKEKQYPQCLFWCHLVLEKLLKAHVVHHSKTQAPYTHNLVQLSEQTGLEFSAEQKKALSIINEFNLKGRYGDELTEFIQKCTSDFAEKYFSITQQFYIWLKEIPLQ